MLWQAMLRATIDDSLYPTIIRGPNLPLLPPHQVLARDETIQRLKVVDPAGLRDKVKELRAAEEASQATISGLKRQLASKEHALEQRSSWAGAQDKEVQGLRQALARANGMRAKAAAEQVRAES